MHCFQDIGFIFCDSVHWISSFTTVVTGSLNNILSLVYMCFIQKLFSSSLSLIFWNLSLKQRACREETLGQTIYWYLLNIPLAVSGARRGHGCLAGPLDETVLVSGLCWDTFPWEIYLWRGVSLTVSQMAGFKLLFLSSKKHNWPNQSEEQMLWIRPCS